MGADALDAVRMIIARSRPHQEAIAVRFETVRDRNTAEALRGALIFVPTDQLEELEEHSYWEHELVGLEVVDRHGRRLGELTEVLARPEQDLWNVRTGETTVLLPAARQLVLGVDLVARRVVVDPPEGLFDREGES